MSEKKQETPNEAEERKRKAVELQSILEKSGRSVEKKQAVVGNKTEYNVMGKGGQKDEVSIHNTTAEINSSNKALKEGIESNNLTHVDANGARPGSEQEKFIAEINSNENLTANQKAAINSQLNGVDFSKMPEAAVKQQLQEMKEKAKQLETAKDNTKKPNEMEEALVTVMGREPKGKVAESKAPAPDASKVASMALAAKMAERLITK